MLPGIARFRGACYFCREHAFAFRKDKQAIQDALIQAPLRAKPNYTNVMRYCPRLVRQYASKAAAVSGSRFIVRMSPLQAGKFLQNLNESTMLPTAMVIYCIIQYMGFAQKHLSAFILLCFVILLSYYDI